MTAKSSVFRMRVKANERMTDAACDDCVTSLKLVPVGRNRAPAFRPGQFVRIGIPGADSPPPAYFAIASDPRDLSHYEFFIKCSGPLAEYLCRIRTGEELEVEGPLGKGFAIDRYPGMDVYLIGVGTGIAPLRSVWHQIIADRDRYGRVAIYAGFLTPLHRLLTDELEALSEHRIEVTVTLEVGHDSWDGPIGFVQHALEADAPDGSNAVACLAGMSAMVDACRQTLQNLGFDDSRILLNY